MPHYVYIIECQNKTFYTGITDSVGKRMAEHQTGKSKSTQYRRPIKLKCFLCFPNKSKAAQFEKYLKSHSGRAFLKKHLI
ncbi:MAG: GIY-YIG nuclease family protein [Patescibacteria group bacterium]